MKFALSLLNLAVTGVTISESIVKVDNGVVMVNNKGFQHAQLKVIRCCLCPLVLSWS